AAVLGRALAGRAPGRASIPGHRPAPRGQPGSGGFRRAPATACPGGGVTGHEGGSTVKKLLLAAGLAVTGLLAAAAPPLTAPALDRPPAPAPALTPAAPALAAASAPNFGYYDNQPIEYQATAEVTASPQQAQVLAAGNIVYHVVDATGTVPAVQLARAQAAFPGDAGAGNVLNFIPIEVGY